MTQTATVTKVLSDGRAEISVKRASACGHNCEECAGGCELISMPPVSAVARNDAGARVGDKVIVESHTGKVLRIAALVYLLPFALFFLGYVLGAQLFKQTWAGGALGAAGFLVSFLPIWRLNARVGRQKELFRIVRICSGE